MPNPFVTTGSPPPQQEPANSSQVAVAASITTSTPICEVWPSQSSSQFASSYPPIMGGAKFHSMSNNESGAGAPPPPPQQQQQQQGTNFLHHTPQQHSLARQSSAVKRSIRKAKMQEKRTGEAHRRGVGSKNTGGTRCNKGPPHHLQGLVMASGVTTNQFHRTPHGPPSQQAEAAKPHHNATSFAPNSDALLAPPPHPPSSAPLFKNLQLGKGAYTFL